MTRRHLGLVWVGILGLTGASCRQPPDVVYQKSVTDAQVLLEQGETNKAVGVLRALFDNKRFAGLRPELLNAMLRFELGAGDVTGAQGLFCEVADRDPALAGSTIGVIEGALSSQKRNDELVAWCVRLQGYDFAESTVMSLADRHFAALMAGGKAGEVPVALDTYFGKLKEPAALGLAQRQFGAALGSGRSGDAEQIMMLVGKHVGDSPARKGTVVGMQIDLSIAANDRPAADAHLRGNLGQIPDDSAVRNLRVVGEADMKAGEVDAADGLAVFTMDTVKERAAVREAAGALWVRVARQHGSIPELVRRLVSLKDHGFPPAFTLNQTDTVYSMLLDQGTKEDFAPMYALFQEFYAEAGDEAFKQSLVGVLLDLGFYLEKYEESLKLVETGMKGSDTNQTQMLAWKIKGHIALQKGQTQEAVRNFRAFMACLALGSGYEVDPADCTRVSKDMILGLNAKRIGDILAGAGDQAAAAQAYAEARADYQKALIEFPDEKTKEHQKIKKQLSGISGK